MKSISKWISGIAVLALSSSLAVAGQNGGQRMEGRGGRRHDGARMAEKLNLSPEQRQQSESMRRDFREQNAPFLDSFHQNMKEYREARKAGDTAKADSLKPALESQREQMKQLRVAQRERFQSILTTDQRAQLEQMKAERQARRQQSGRN